MNKDAETHNETNGAPGGTGRPGATQTIHAVGLEAVALLGLLIQQRWLFPLSEQTSQAVGFVVLLIGLAGSGMLRPWRLGLPLAAAALVAHRFAPDPARFSHLCIDTALIGLVSLRGVRASGPLVAGVVAVLLAAVLEHALPSAMVAVAAIGRDLSEGVSRFFNTAPNLGTTYLGLVPACAFSAFFATLIARGRSLRKSKKRDDAPANARGKRAIVVAEKEPTSPAAPAGGPIRIALGLLAGVALLATWIVAACVLNEEIGDIWVWLTFSAPIIQQLGFHMHHSHHDPWLMAFVPFVLSLFAVGGLALLGRFVAPITPSAPPRHAVWRVATLVILGAALGFLPRLDWSGDLTRSKAVLYETGLVDWTVPHRNRNFGVGRSGMFGQFEIFLHRLGFDVSKTETLDNLPEPEKSLLFLLNPKGITPENARRVRDFVRDGGALFVMGDHTDMEGIAEHLDRVLGFAGAAFRFDSAFPVQRTWRTVYRTASHPVVDRLGGMNERLQQGTGASLELSGWSWKPVVWAQYAFSDLGNRLNARDAYLGDYTYQPGELLGDLVLAAVRTHGQGRIAVFGDTSGIQNLSIGRSAGFFRDVLTHLCAPSRTWLDGVNVGLAILTILALVAVPRLDARPLGGFALACLAGLVVVGRFHDREMLHPAGAEKLAVIDAAHFNALTLEHFKVNSVDGLFNCLMRNEYWPAAVVAPQSPADIDAEAYFIIAPGVPLESREITTLLQRVENGASLIVSAGYEESYGLRELLDRIEIEIGNIPLGPIPFTEKIEDPQRIQDFRRSPHFTEAWPLRWEEGVPWQEFYGWRAFTAVAARPWGEGRIIVIGDSRFLLDETLETEKDYWPGNIKYFEVMMSTWPLEARPEDLQPTGERDG